MLRSVLPRLNKLAQPSARIATRALATAATSSSTTHTTTVEDLHHRTVQDILAEGESHQAGSACDSFCDGRGHPRPSTALSFRSPEMGCLQHRRHRTGFPTVSKTGAGQS